MVKMLKEKFQFAIVLFNVSTFVLLNFILAFQILHIKLTTILPLSTIIGYFFISILLGIMIGYYLKTFMVTTNKYEKFKNIFKFKKAVNHV